MSAPMWRRRRRPGLGRGGPAAAEGRWLCRRFGLGAGPGLFSGDGQRRSERLGARIRGQGRADADPQHLAGPFRRGAEKAADLSGVARKLRNRSWRGQGGMGRRVRQVRRRRPPTRHCKSLSICPTRPRCPGLRPGLCRGDRLLRGDDRARAVSRLKNSDCNVRGNLSVYRHQATPRCVLGKPMDTTGDPRCTEPIPAQRRQTDRHPAGVPGRFPGPVPIAASATLPRPRR